MQLNWITKYIKSIYLLYCSLFVSDKTFLRRHSKRNLGYKINIDNPTTLNEKVQWLKLNNRTPLHTICTDKYLARNYISEKVGADHLVPLVFETKDPEQINSDILPDYPVIIKTNHDSGGIIVVEDKNQADWKSIREKLKIKLKRNFFFPHRQWSYKNIEKRIIVERFLIDKKKKFPDDIRVHCFNGKPGFITIDSGRFGDMKSGMYDTEWNYLDCEWTDPQAAPIEKPVLMDEVLELASKLSENFIYVRTDFYIVQNKIYVGELTFYPCAGWKPFKPEKWDRIFGNMLLLPTEKQKETSSQSNFPIQKLEEVEC